MAVSKPPCAFWPLTITAGVNDYIDFTINGGAEMSARIAAATYYSIASLLAACGTAVENAHLAAGTTFSAVGGSVAATSPTGSTWTSRTVPAGTYRSVAWGGSTFVAVGPSVAATSPDGVTWTSRTIPAGTYYTVAWNGTNFVAAGLNVAATSPDGVTWTSQSIPAGLYYSLAWSGNTLVAVGLGVAATSPDCVTWTSRTIPAGTYAGVSWTGSRFVAVGVSAAATSADGAAWSAAAIPAGTYYALAWTGDSLVAVGASVVAVSLDGEAWTAGSIPAGTYYSVSWNGMGLSAVGDSVAATSPDGVTWTSRTIPAGTYYGQAWDMLASLTALFSTSTSGRVVATTSSSGVFKFSTGTHAATSARDVLGFGAVDTASGTTHTGTLQHQNGWYPEKPCVFDSREESEITRAGVTANAGNGKIVTFGSQRYLRRVAFAWLPEWKAKIAREGAHTNEALERLWLYGAARLRWWPDATDPATYVDAYLDQQQLDKFAPDRDERLQLYSYTLTLRHYV